MKKLIYLVLFLTLYTSNIFGCALCKLNIPNVHINVKAITDKNSTSLNFQWEFDEKFTNEVLFSYDENNNKTLDKNEIQNVKKNLEDYISKDSYLTFIQLTTATEDHNKTKPLSLNVSDTNMEYKHKKLLYSYNVILKQPLTKESLLSIQLVDKGYYFNFILRQFHLNGIEAKEIEKNRNYVLAYMYDKNNIPKTTTTTTTTAKLQEKKITQNNTILNKLSNILTKVKNRMEALLEDIKNNNSLSSYFWLLLLSFIYGIIHAIGPGHGKSLVSAYFLSANRSVLKAFNISLLIGVVHTFSAFVLTFSIYYLLNFFLSNSHITNINLIATKVSAIVIILIALYLLSKKLKTKKSKITFQPLNSKQSFVKVPNTTPRHIHTSSCGCNACNTTSTDISVILSAGIVPCPGTVTIFIFTMSLGVYFVGFLSALFMSLGMSLIIFIAAYLSINVRKKANSNKTFVKILEYGSLVFILFLGIILFILN